MHLQYTGHPIANDVLYLSKDVASRSTEGTGADRAASGLNFSSPCCLDKGHDIEDPALYEFDVDPMCTNCPNLGPKG